MNGLLYRTAKQSDSDPRDYVLSDESIDRYGDVITAGGWDLSNFKNHPIALFNHHADAIIGRWENVRIEGKKLLGRLTLAAEGTSATVDEIRRLWQQKMLRAVSVGFRPTEQEKLTDKADEFFGPFRYLRQELVEASLVAVPANPNALQVSRSFTIPADVRKQLFGKLAQEERSASSASPPGKLARTHLQRGGHPMKISKKIEDGQKRLLALRDHLQQLVDKEDPDDEEIALRDGQILDEITALEAEIEIWRKQEKALAVRTVEQTGQDGEIIPPDRSGQQRPFAIPAKKVLPRDYILRAAIITGLAHHLKQPRETMLKQAYGSDEATGILLRAAMTPAMTTVPGWAAELVDTIMADFMVSLQPVSVYAQLHAMGVPLTFDRAGIIKIPARTATPQINGDFVGEGQPIPVRRIGLTSISLTPKKVAVISEFTDEMAQHSAPSIEAVLREAIRDDTAVVIDNRLLDTVAATAIRPAGLRAGVAALTPSAATNPTDAMIADLRALVGALTAVNGGRRIAIILNTVQAMGLGFAQTATGDFLFSSADEAGRKFNVTFIASNNVPAGVVIAVDAADFVSATGDAPQFDMSNQATIHEEDTTPLPINAGTPAVPIRSLWQTDSIGIRMKMPLNWAMRRQGMVAWMEDVLW